MGLENRNCSDFPYPQSKAFRGGKSTLRVNLKLQSLWCSAVPGNGNEDGDGIFRTWACTGGGRWGEGTALACRLTLLPWLAVPTGIHL